MEDETYTNENLAKAMSRLKSRYSIEEILWIFMQTTGGKVNPHVALDWIEQGMKESDPGAIYIQACKAGSIVANLTVAKMHGRGCDGYAYVSLLDLRDPLARWCKENKIGCKGVRGWKIFVDSGSCLEGVNGAYADAMAKVFTSYGIDCLAMSAPD